MCFFPTPIVQIYIYIYLLLPSKNSFNPSESSPTYPLTHNISNPHLMENQPSPITPPPEEKKAQVVSPHTNLPPHLNSPLPSAEKCPNPKKGGNKLLK